jgi:hypothetical protein
MFLLFFSITAVSVGFMLLYLKFSGSTKMGLYFIILGIIVLTVGFLYFDRLFPRPLYNPSNVYQALVSVIATFVGFLASIIVAFIVITKIGPSLHKNENNHKFLNNNSPVTNDEVKPIQSLKAIDEDVEVRNQNRYNNK